MTSTHIGLRSKLTLLSIGLVILTAMGIATYVVHREITARYDDLVTTGQTTAAMIAQSSEYAIYTENHESLKRIVAGAHALPDIAYVAVLGKNGQILLEQTFGHSISIPTNHRDRLPLPNEIITEEVSIRESAVPHIDILVPAVSRSSSSDSSIFLEETSPSSQAIPIGYIQIGLSQEALKTNIRQFIQATGLVTLFVIGIGFLLSWLVTRTITKPVYTLIEAAGRVAEGRYDVEVPATTSDEIHTLAAAFNHMLANLRTAQAQVLEYQRGLESKVAERTSQLESAKQEAERLASELSRTVSTLQDNQRLLNAIVENLPMMVFAKDPGSLAFIRWNRAAEDMTGITRDEILGKTAYERFGHREADDYTATDRQVLETGKVLDIAELHINTKHRGRRILHTKKLAVIDNSGNPLCLLGIAEDITDRTNAENATREQMRLSLLTAEVNSALAQKDGLPTMLQHCADTLVERLDAALARIWLIKPTDLCDDCSHASTCSNRAECLHLAAGSGLSQDLDSRFHRVPLGALEIGKIAQDWGAIVTNDVLEDDRLPDKPWFREQGLQAFAGYPLIINGQTVGVVALYSRQRLSNQTLQALERLAPMLAIGIERQRAEEALRTSELRLSLTVRGAQIGIWDWDLVTNTVYYSPEWKNQLGHTDQEILNGFHEWESRVHPDDLSPALNAIDDYLNQRSETYEFAHRLRHKDGAYRWIMTRGALFDDPTTLSKRMVGIHIDLTEQKQVQDDLKAAKEHAEAANVAKSQFLANMSHEIRTPMNGVLGMTELLLTTPLTDKQRRMAVTVQQSAHSLLTIINDILDFSKIEAGKLQLERMDVDIHPLFDDTMGMLAESARRKGLELSCFVPPALPAVVRGDPTRLRQILMNLVGNAIKFTAQGHVTVTVSCLERTASQITIKVSIADTGVGIAPDVHNRIFEAFSQADGSTTRQYGGTGLGLTIVKQLVELMGGTIGFESAIGVGSTFWFTLTLEYRPDQAPSTPSQTLQGLPVIAVDDHETNRHILQEYLTAWGMRPDVVANAEAALRLLRPDHGAPRPYALAVLDIHMPGMDGLTLARQIMQDPRWAALPLVALSSTDSTETGAPLTASGFACALRKPMQPSLLKRCLERVLTRAAQASADSLVTTDPPTMPRLATNTRILLVEDNPVNREVCLAMLDLLGCHADSAIDGTEAVEAVCRTPFDLILMDCQMPGMNGFDATAAIRRWEATMPDRRRTPIIALTANAMEGDRDRCLAAGMDDYLTKPFSANQLGDILAQWLPPQETPSSPTLQTTLAQVSTPLHLTAPPAGASLPPSSTEYPVPPTSNSLVDFSAWEPINMMARSGRPSLLAKLLTAYLADARPLVEQIREAVAQANSATLTAAAHRLKSSSAVLGAMTVAALCKDLEACGRTEQIKDAQPLVPRLERDFEAVCAIFQQERHKEQAA